MFEPILELLGKKYSEKQIKPRHLFYASCIPALALFYAASSEASDNLERKLNYPNLPISRGLYEETGELGTRCYQEIYLPVNEHVTIGFKKYVPCNNIKKEKEINL